MVCTRRYAGARQDRPYLVIPRTAGGRLTAGHLPIAKRALLGERPIGVGHSKGIVLISKETTSG